MEKLQLTRTGKALGKLSWLMIKGILGIIVITLAIAATAATYLICLPFLLFSNMRQMFRSENN